MESYDDTSFDNRRHPADSDYDRVYDSIDIPLSELPVTVRLGVAATRYHVVGASQAHSVDRMLNTDEISVFILSTNYNPGDATGYKAVRNHETVVLGREGSPRFPITESTVSRKAAIISREDHVVHIEDPSSLNGLYIAKQMPYAPKMETVPLDDTFVPIEIAESIPSGELVQDSGYFSEMGARKISNEDAQFIDGSSLGVFDGVGSSKYSTFASNFAADDIRNQLRALPARMDSSTAEKRMRTIIANTTKRLHDICEQRRINDAATTATFATTYKDDSGEMIATILSSGDSRAYLLRNGHLEHLTIDDATSVHHHGAPRNTLNDTEEEQCQVILGSARSYEDIHKEAKKLAHSERQAAIIESVLVAKHKRRNVIQNAIASYIPETHYSIEHVPIKTGDMLILTTDGIHDALTTQQIESIAKNSNSASDVARNLAHAARPDEQREADPVAYDFRSKSDDRTAAIMQF